MRWIQRGFFFISSFFQLAKITEGLVMGNMGRSIDLKNDFCDFFLFEGLNHEKDLISASGITYLLNCCEVTKWNPSWRYCWKSLKPIDNRNSTDFAFINDGFEGVHDEPDGVGYGKHPNPALNWFVPYQQFLNIFVDNDVNRVVNGRVLIDGTYRVVHGHAVISCVVL
jgi:hypothetical protein